MVKVKEKEKAKNVKFIYSENDPPCFYVHGARGGPTSIYDFRINFYTEKKRIEDVEILKEEGESETFFSRSDEEYDEYIIIDREIQVSILLSLPAARELASWLTKRISEFENLVTKIEEEKDSL